ncbi:MAG: tetratricopeptide repeat protein, partial [Deltaproteobacteria bacterium]
RILRFTLPQDAEKSMKQGVAVDPDDPSLSVVMGNFYRRINRTEDAAAAYKMAIAKAKDPEKKEDYQALLANFHFEQRQVDAGRGLMEQVLKRNAKHPLARLLKAKFLIREKKNPDALAILDELLESQPRWGEAYFQKALAHLAQGETELSLKAVTEALKYSPKVSEAHTLRAHLLFLKRDFDGAKKEAALALRLNPNNLGAAVIAGKAMLGNKEADNALKLFQQMEKAMPDNDEIKYYKALSLLALGKKTEAANLLTDILGKKPDFVPVFVTLTAMDEQAGKIGDAIARAEKQVKLLPENGIYQQLLGILLTKDKQYEKAVTCFRKAEQLDPQNPKNYVQLAFIFKKQGKLDDAIAEYQGLVKAKPDFVPAYMGLGTLLQLMGKTAEAKEAFQQALTLDGTFAPAANNLAWLLAGEKQPDLGEALRLALIAKEKLPDDPNVADTLGWIHYKRESYDLALTQLSQAVEGQPDNSTVRYHMALVLNALNKKEEARQELEKALDKKSEFPERKQAQALLLSLQKTKG